MKKAKWFVMLVLLMVPLVLSGCVSNGYTSEFEKPNRLVETATSGAGYMSNLIETHESSVPEEQAAAGEMVVGIIKPNAEMLTFYNVVALMLEAFDRAGVSVNVKQKGNEYIIDYDGNKVHLEKNGQVITLKYTLDDQPNQIIFTFAEGYDAFDMLYKEGNEIKCSFGYKADGDKEYYLMATESGEGFQVAEMLTLTAGEKVTSYSLKVYNEIADRPSSILDGIDAGFAAGSGSYTYN